MPQVSGKVKIPKGKKVAVNIGCDFDAQAIWIGSFNLTSPAYMSRGEFGAEVAVYVSTDGPLGGAASTVIELTGPEPKILRGGDVDPELVIGLATTS